MKRTYKFKSLSIGSRVLLLIINFSCSSQDRSIPVQDNEGKDKDSEFYGGSYETMVSKWTTLDGPGVDFIARHENGTPQPTVSTFSRMPGYSSVREVVLNSSIQFKGCPIATADPLSLHAGSLFEMRLKIAARAFALVNSGVASEAGLNRMFSLKIEYSEGGKRKGKSIEIPFRALTYGHIDPRDDKIAVFHTNPGGDWIDLGPLHSISFSQEVSDLTVSFCDFATVGLTIVEFYVGFKLPSET